MVKEKILNARNVTKRFGGLVAVNNVSLYVARNELVALIGPNGAGKTTMFNLLTGISPATSGTITLKKDGHSVDISHMKTYKIAQKGISRTAFSPRWPSEKTSSFLLLTSIARA